MERPDFELSSGPTPASPSFEYRESVFFLCCGACNDSRAVTCAACPILDHTLVAPARHLWICTGLECIDHLSK